jgi:dynein heavy chain
MKRGHAFLVGVGGSGRHSLTRLAAYIQEFNESQVEITKGFNLKAFREFLKEMYKVAGFKGKKTLSTVFIFSDNDVVHPSFLEDIQNMLNGGVVPNLYSADELGQLRESLRRPYKRMAGGVETAENLEAFFFNNIKDNLHLSICFSPIGQAFKDYCKQYPALINNTTIDWFMGWPDEALTEVAMKFIGQLPDIEEYQKGLSELCSYAHSTT